MLKLFVANLKMLVRNRQALFWAMMFPVMFTIIFGFFFGNDNQVAGTIALINHSQTELAKNLEKAVRDSTVFKISGETDETKIKDEIKKTAIAGAVIIPEKFGEMNIVTSNKNLPPIVTPAENSTKIKVIYDPANQTVNIALLGFIRQYLTQVDFQVQKAQPIYQIEEEKTNSNTLGYFDFVLTGLIGMALMNSSIMGLGVVMVKYREDKILKRITTTPLKTWKFIVAEVLSRLIVNIIQVSVILAIGVYGFHAHIYGNIFGVYGLALLAAVLFQLMGFTIASIAKNTEAAEGMATAISIPMMFLAGVFFPIDSLPKWLFGIVQYLPLAPLLRMSRGYTLESASILTDPRNLTIVLGWIAGCLLISIWRFRLTDE